MNWQQFLPVVLILGVVFVFIWRSSAPKKHVHGEHCDCGHDHGNDAKKEKSASH
jgi:hypothetical protein